jgi:PEP-CTERM motif
MIRPSLIFSATVAFASPASAATLVYDYGIKPGAQAIDLFNPALGTLQSVTGEFTGTEIVSITTNLTVPTLVTYTASGFYSVYVGPLFFDFTGSAQGAGSVTVGGGPANISLSGGTTQVRTSALALAVFTGVGTILASPQVDPPFSINLSSGFVTGTSLVSTATSYKITYTYAPLAGAVPEPASWAFMLAGFACAGAALRTRRRSRMTAAAHL